MNKKAFALIEILVVITIGLILIGLIFGLGNTNSDEPYNAFAFPKQAQAQAAQQQVEELKEQNRLLRELVEKNVNK